LRLRIVPDQLPLGLCRNLQRQTGQTIVRIRVLPEGVNNDGSASLGSFGNPLKPAMPKSALPMRRTAKTPLIWLPKLHLLLVASELVRRAQPA
jgi:hypothetical protein